VLASEFEYHLPADRIAQTPVEPRHSSRLLDSRTMSDHHFLDLADLLQPGDLVVVNRTRVRHARLHGRKDDSGGRVEVLLLGALADGTWEAMIRPARRVRDGTKINFDGLAATVIGRPEDGLVRMELVANDDIETVIERIGEIPLPPYIQRAPEDPDRYQTVYADSTGSAAAPTAGLHFTEEALGRLERAGIGLAFIDLQVGLATFRPLAVDDIADHVMHREWFTVSAETAGAIDRCRRRGGRVVAIGTTTLRTLETVATSDGMVTPGDGSTDLYLKPGDDIRCVDLLVTNFHLPRSSLLVLLEAFMGPGWRSVYETALARGYRFLSFGDAMVCERR
jgi:S-adenosylmethionine:tRNA ribosyltransferase-isomerase